MKPSPSSKPVTLREIAERAGVSICTVSMSLRDHPRISAETRRRIQKIAKTVGYRPDALVATLMARIHTKRPSFESPVLGFILEEEDQGRYARVPFYRELIEGARDRAFQLGYQLEKITLTRGLSAARALCRTLHARNIRGVIVAPFSEGSECRLPFDGLASCALGYTLHKPDLHRVVPNYAQGMRLAWHTLLQRGYRRPGFVCTRPHLASTHYERFAAFAAQQEIHSELKPIPPLIFPRASSEDIDGCMSMFMKWFRRHRPDVLIFPPWALLKRLREEIRIPEEAGVILTDVEPGWSQVREGASEIGSAAVDHVVAQIHRNETGVPVSPKQVAVNNHWVDGFSLPQRK